MSIIYSDAELVISSIANDNPDIELAFKIFKSAEELLLPMELCKIREKSWLHSLVSLFETDPVLGALESFANLEYWKRVWITQETSLAKRLVFCCGSASLEWTIAKTVSSILRQAFAHDTVVHGGPSDVKTVELILCDLMQPRVSIIEMQDRNTLPVEKLETVLKLRFQASDPKDQVYGLLGLCGIPIEVEYTKSVGEVYADLFQWYASTPYQLSCGHFRQSDVAFLLQYGGVRSETPAMPSWTPSLDNKKSYTIKSPGSSSPDPLEGFHPITVQYPLLVLGGIRLKSIKKSTSIVGEPKDKSEPKDKDTINLAFFDQVRTFICQNPTYATGIPSFQAVLRALVEVSGRQFEDMTSYLFYYWVYLIKAPKRLGWILDPISRENFHSDDPREAFRFFFSKAFGDPESSALFNCDVIDETKYHRLDMIDMCELSSLRNKAFFETEDGYVGIGLECVQPGDQVYLLQQCDTLCILRRSDDHHVLVGTCFILGLNKSNDVAKLLESEDHEVEEVSLQ